MPFQLIFDWSQLSYGLAIGNTRKKKWNSAMRLDFWAYSAGYVSPYRPTGLYPSISEILMDVERYDLVKNVRAAPNRNDLYNRNKNKSRKLIRSALFLTTTLMYYIQQIHTNSWYMLLDLTLYRLRTLSPINWIYIMEQLERDRKRENDR
jgi:hypothetical protein